jgi:hypothetical protein
MQWPFARPAPGPRRGRLSASGVLALVATLLASALVVWEALPSSRRLVSLPPEASAEYERIGYLPDLYVAYVAADGRMFGIEDHFIYASEDRGRTFRELGVLPKVDPGFRDRAVDLLARSKLVRSIRRNEGPSNLVVLSTGTILVFWDHIYRSTDNGRTFTSVFDFAEQNATDAFPHGEGLAVGPDDTVYFGEYVTTKRPNAVKVYRGLRDGTAWETAHVFPAGEIFHIHAIQYDPHRLGYWVTTGDRDEESKVLFTRDGFKTFSVLGGGNQNWRVVSMIVAKDRLVWGSDNDQTGASIFQWDFGSGALTELESIGKPSYSSTRLADGTFVVSTTYEPDSPYTRAARPQPTTDLWASKDGLAWTKLLSLPHQTRQHESGFSRAEIVFPGGASTRELYFTPLWTVDAAFTTQVIQPSRSQ